MSARARAKARWVGPSNCHATAACLVPNAKARALVGTHVVEVAKDLEPRRREEPRDAFDILLPGHQHEEVADRLVPPVTHAMRLGIR
jgi:hypothetical protein